VQIAQRLVGVSSKNADTGMLTEEEKSQLLKNIKSDFESVLAEQDDLDITVSGMKK
jgi:hypothetical protein